MSAEFGGFPSPETNTESDKKKLKRLRFLPESNKEKNPKPPEVPVEQPAQPRLSEALLQQLITKEDKNKEKAAPEFSSETKAKQADEAKPEKEVEKPELPAQETEAATERPEELPQLTTETSEADVEEADETEVDTEQTYREMLSQELSDNQRGSEVVVNLSGEAPIAEQEIPLRLPEATTEEDAPMPVYSPQELQQQMSRDEQEPSEEEPATTPEPEPTPEEPQESARPEQAPPEPEAGGGGGGEVPPTEPPESVGERPEEPEPEPEPTKDNTSHDHSGSYEAPPGSTRASVNPNERAATKEELDEAFARSAKVHGQRGVLSGLFFGTLWANRRIKNRQKHETKELRKQGRELQNLNKQVQSVSQNQESQQRNTERRFAAVDRRFENIQHPEKAAAKEKAEKARTAELVQVDPSKQELLKIPEDHRLETSAWHTIEVDNKTGRPVEAPTFEYGHEYYRERAQESAPADQRTAAAGNLVLSAIAQQTSDNQKGQGSGSNVPNASTQGPPKSAKERAKAALNSVTKSGQQSGPIWPYLIALAVVIVLLVSVLS